VVWRVFRRGASKERDDPQSNLTEQRRCGLFRRRQKIATFIPSTFARSSTRDLEMSAHGPPRVYAHNTGNPFISDYETAVMA
jgi:hypothetical protein